MEEQEYITNNIVMIHMKKTLCTQRLGNMKIKLFDDMKEFSVFINVVKEITRSIDGFKKYSLRNNSQKVKRKNKKIKNGKKKFG